MGVMGVFHVALFVLYLVLSSRRFMLHSLRAHAPLEAAQPVAVAVAPLADSWLASTQDIK